MNKKKLFQIADLAAPSGAKQAKNWKRLFPQRSTLLVVSLLLRLLFVRLLTSVLQPGWGGCWTKVVTKKCPPNGRGECTGVQKKSPRVPRTPPTRAKNIPSLWAILTKFCPKSGKTAHWPIHNQFWAQSFSAQRFEQGQTPKRCPPTRWKRPLGIGGWRGREGSLSLKGDNTPLPTPAPKK